MKTSMPDYRAFKRCIIVTVIALILSILFFSLRQAQEEYRQAIKAAEVQSRGYARALREHAERAFGEVDGLLLDTIRHIKTYDSITDVSSENLRNFLGSQARKIPQAAAIVLIDRHGNLFAHSLDLPVKTSSSADRDFFIHHQTSPQDDTPFISKPFKSRLHNNWRFTISRPIRSADGAFAGVVAIGFQPEYFQEFYRSIELGNQGRFIMMRRDGVLLLSEPAKETDLTTDFKKSLLFRHYLPQAPKGTFHIKKGQALLEPSARIISYDSLPGFPVVVSANMSKDEVTAAWRESTYSDALLAAGACAALLLLTYLLLRQVRRIEDSFRRQAEQQAEITTAAATWQTTFDSVGDAIWVMDLDRRILRCNKATQTIFGKNADQIIGQLCCSVAHRATAPLSTCPFQQMLDTRQRAALQLAIGEQWIEVTVDPVIREDGSVTGAVHIISDITTIKAAEERYRQLVENLPVVCWQADEQGITHFISPVVTTIEGYTPEELYAGGEALWLERVHPDDRQMVSEAFTALMEHGAAYDVQYRIRHKAGHWVWLHDSAYATMLQNGLRIAHGVYSDVTARKQAEEERDQLEIQLRQAQKMEAIGHLAGGIAHDFNNLLTPIMGYTEMALTSADDLLASRLKGVMAAANKAKELTQQLLGFGRRQSITTQTIDLNEVIVSFNDILRRTIRESIQIDLRLDPQGVFIKGDPSRIEQVILNLTVNAQDAFQNQGRIVIETCKVIMDGEAARLHPGMLPGEYVLLSFSDNGCGMSSEVMSHIFEPFFTTKQAGHGTGLGLATVYGVVKQHQAHISVTSHEGEGTCFRIYFTSCTQCALPSSNTLPEKTDKKVDEVTILVVEDNEMVRMIVGEMLGGRGYHILTAADPHAALALVAAGHHIDLLISDVVMPGMSGPELYEQLAVLIPGLKVVYISGYPVNPGLRHDTLEDQVSYLQKPFTAEALLERIRMAL